MPAAATTYKTVLKDNNINGRVLLHCDLDELKKLLKMTFGDWEMFRVMIVSLREHEMTTVVRQDESRNTVRFSENKTTAVITPKDRRGNEKLRSREFLFKNAIQYAVKMILTVISF